MSDTKVMGSTAEPNRLSAAQGVLFIVPTPIGNLADMVPRAAETLQQVDVIAAEDTRHSKRLLEHFHISTPLLAYHDHNEQHLAAQLVERMQKGEKIALISDAGTPLVSDPGYRLVAAAQNAGIKVVPIPGPCAAIVALSAAGLPSDKFIFEGFLPAKSAQRQKQLGELIGESRTVIFYEAPHRLLACLEDVVTTLGDDRQIVIARELTKTFETILSGTAKELLERVQADANQQKGEIVLLVRGVEKVAQELDATAEKILLKLLEELPPKKAAQITAEITGVNKKVLYNLAVAQKT